ncbi:unnamed protein product [Alopecurus aequalis]
MNFLNISPFDAPMELFEFIAMHTNAKIREFQYHEKAIMFTRHMVVKVLGVPSGPRRLDLLKRSQESDLRDMYRNDKGRPTIAKAIHELEHYDENDEAVFVRNFGLVALATVLCPGTGNMTNLEYLASLMDRDSLDQYAFDENILAEVMSEVEVFQVKIKNLRELDVSKIQWVGQCMPFLALLHLSETIYVDPVLAPPPNADVNNGSQDGEVNASASLNEWIEKGFSSSQDFEVPERLQGIFNKHKELYTVEADVALTNFGVVMKSLHARRTAALLFDVDAANRESNNFSIPCPLSFAGESCANAPQDTLKKEATQSPPASTKLGGDEEKEAAPLNIPEKQCVQEEAAPCNILEKQLVQEEVAPRNIPEKQLVQEEAAPCNISEKQHFEEDSSNVVGVVQAVFVEEVMADIEKGVEKNDEPTELGGPARTMPASPIEVSPARTVPASPIEVYPRRRIIQSGYWDDHPYMELFEPGSPEADFFANISDPIDKSPSALNIAIHSPATATSEDSSGYARSLHRDEVVPSIGPAVRIIKDPAKFEINKCIAEFKNACVKFNLVKIYLITNFKNLAEKSGTFNVDFSKFKLGGPSDYPQQTTLYDCGFFVMLYMEHLDGRTMMIFDKNSIPTFCKTLVVGFINNTMNTKDSKAVLEDELE